MTFSDFVQYILHGISLGSIYALIAVGYSIIFGILRLINMAHGHIFMMAAFLAMWGVRQYLIPLPISYFLGVVIATITMVVIDRVAYRPFRKHSMSAYVTAVAAGFLVQNSVIVFFTPYPFPFPRPAFAWKVFHFGDICLPLMTLIILAIGTILFLALFYLVSRTKMGRAMRAVSEDLEASRLMGIEPNRVISFAFAIASIYAGIGALAWGMKYPMAQFTMGVIPGIKGNVASVMGGVGSMPGALLGGFILGFAEIMFVAFLPTLTMWRDVVAYSLMLVFLIFRPGGIFNVSVVEEKV